IRAERSFEFIKKAEGNWDFVKVLRNFLNLFRIISNHFKNANTSTIAVYSILKTAFETEND
ncbi:MAG TPA: hypothetical protein VIU13_00120, partial [Chryseolinea sp.]